MSRTVTTDGAGNRTYLRIKMEFALQEHRSNRAKGDKGDTGGTGATGKGVKSIVEQYYKINVSNSHVRRIVEHDLSWVGEQ